MARSPESYYIGKIDRQGNSADKQHYIENETFDREIAAVWNKVRPKYGDFLRKNNEPGTFELTAITRDRQLVKRFTESSAYENERANTAVGMEYVVMEGIHEHGWLGEGASVTPSIEYDDVINGIDMTVTFDNPDGKALHLGIDTTTSRELKNIDKKLNRTAEDLLNGNLAHVKYFINDQTGERGSIFLPRVVLASSKESISELINTLIENPKAVDGDTIQIEMINEIIDQLQFGLDMMKNHGTKSQIDVYQDLLVHLQQVKKEKGLSITQGDGQAQKIMAGAVEHQRRQYLPAA